MYQQKDKDWQSRTEQQRLFGLLCQESALKLASVPGTDRSALQKRLQRARKFLFVAEAFGTPVLDMAPEVSISRLDDLQGLTWPGERGELKEGVETVVRKIRLAEAMCVSHLGHRLSYSIVSKHLPLTIFLSVVIPYV
jgi:hypothetical protein